MMEKIGKRTFTCLIAFLLGLSPVWANIRIAPLDSLLQQSSQGLPPDFHQVEKGDTYFGLSRRYRVPVDSLKSWNGEILRLGTTVRVRSKAGKAGQPGLPEDQARPAKTAALRETVPTPVNQDSSLKSTPQQPVTTTSRQSDTVLKSFSPDEKQAPRVLIIPFDPALYFSDADDDIARQSSIPKQNVRYIFRSRLNALLEKPQGFEGLNLLGITLQENKTELSRVYQSVSYHYQPIMATAGNPALEKAEPSALTWLRKQKEKLIAAPSPEAAGNTGSARNAGQYYGVKVKDPSLYEHFNDQYAVDYYLFITQFEIHTDYTNCLDRTQQDFIREFVVHYSLLDKQNNYIAGNKVKLTYVSHVNDINKIVRDNLYKISQHILADLPHPAALNSHSNSQQ